MTAFIHLSDDISMINISPLLNLRSIASSLNSRALIIQAYGMGNVPSKNKEFLDLLKRAIEQEIIVVIITQCHRGTVNDLYEAGRVLTDMGAVLGQDMTLECCYAKLSFLLGKGYSSDKIKHMLITNLKGELTDIHRKKDIYTLKNNKLVCALGKLLN